LSGETSQAPLDDTEWLAIPNCRVLGPVSAARAQADQNHQPLNDRYENSRAASPRAVINFAFLSMSVGTLSRQ
jgi:hypothetical protein